MDLSKLYHTIRNRIEHTSHNSYVSELVQSGEDRIIQKVGEEAVEVVIAAKNSDRKLLIYESADLIFHLMVLLASKDVHISEVFTELENRQNK